MSVCALVGGQFGSEGKGLIAGHIARDYDVHVRVGAANAGHTVYTNDGIGWEDPNSWEKHVMQQIPCAAYTNPRADLVIGPGALISPGIFVRELHALNEWRLERGFGAAIVHIDRRAHVITDEQIDAEQQTDLAERIGSTSTIAKEGIGVAAADRVLRVARCTPIGSRTGHRSLESWSEASPGRRGDLPTPAVIYDDVPRWLADRPQSNILLEGTQGTGLSNTTGFFPYCTSRNTTAAGLAADSGVAPNKLERVIVVCRTFPIRVAGNSGPFYPDSREIDWDDIAVDPESERTTVTKKVRRVATFSLEQVRDAVILNGATEIALTFADYVDPMIAGKDGCVHLDQLKEFHPVIYRWVADVTHHTAVGVSYIGTGPRSVLEVLP